MTPVGLGEGVQRHLDRLPEVGSLHRHRVRVHRVQEQVRGAVVQGQGALHERLTGEGDQPDAVAVQMVD